MFKRLKWPLVTWLLLLITSIVFYLTVSGFIVFPSKYRIPLIAAVAGVLLVTAVLSFLMRKKARAVPSVLNLLISIAMIVVCLFLPNLENKLRNIFVETSDTENVEMNVYAMTTEYKTAHGELFKDTDNVITSIDLMDYKNSPFITQSALDQENQAFAVDQIEMTLGVDTLQIVNKADVLEALEALYSGEGEALVLNAVYVDSIKEIPGFENFDTDTVILTTITHEVAVEKPEQDKPTVVEDYTNSPFVVFVAGNDTLGNALLYYGRTDVNLIAAVNPNTRQIILFSIPRDWYVPNPQISNGLDKLTHLGNHGVSNTTYELSEIFGFPINNYVSVNFVTFQNILSAIGGVDIQNPYAFSTRDYYYEEGEIHLEGAQAMQYVRERHNLPDGDFGRSMHQSLVLEGIINKLTSSEIISNYDSLLEALQGQFLTDFNVEDIYSLAAMQLEEGGSWQIIRYSLGGIGEYNVTASMGDRELYVVVPFDSQIEFISEQVNKLLNGETVSQESLPDEGNSIYIDN